MKQEIEISVIIPNYNYGQYIEECICSVLESDFSHAKMEIVIVDDASTDDSIKIVNKIKKTADVQINLIKHKTNSGLAKTRNAGIKNAKGKYLFILDSDNYINKDCLKKHYNFLKSNQEYTACYAPIQRFDNETRELQGIFSNEAYNYHQLTSGNYIDAMSMIKKDDLIEVGLYDEQMPCSGWEDYDLWLRMGAHNKKIYFIDGEPLTQYRIHGDSMINTMPVVDFNNLTTYIKTKFNIKDNGINSLGEKIPSLSEISLQLFWATSDMKFEETKSVHRLIHLDNIAPATFIFNLTITENIYFLRFDLGDKIGFLNIHSIEIKNNAGELIWLWDKSTINIKNGVLLIESSKYFDGKIVQLSTTGDPQIILQINSEGDLRDFIKCTVEITLSKFDFSQIELLNNQIASLLLFHSEKQINQLNGFIDKLIDEKETLTNEIVLTNNSVKKSKEEKLLYDKSIKNYEILIEQYKSDKINFDKDKLFLTNDIGIKNEILNKLMIEKEEVEKVLKEKENKLDEVLTTLNLVGKENALLTNRIAKKEEILSKCIIENKEIKDKIKEKENQLIKASNDIGIAEKEKQKLINQLNDTTNYSKQLSEKINHVEKEATTIKSFHIKNIEALNALIQELTQNNSFLHSEINIKNDSNTRLIHEKEILEKKYIETVKKMQEVTANLSLKEIENKKSNLELIDSLDKSTQQSFQIKELKELLNDERIFYSNNRNAYDMQLLEMIENESKLLSEMNLLKVDSDFLWKNYENRTFLQVFKFRILRRMNMMKNRNP